MIKLVKAGWIAALAVAALSYPVAALVEATAIEAWRITPHPPHLIQGKRAEFEFNAIDRKAPEYASEVAGIYGSPVGQPTRFVFVSRDRLMRPREMPELVLLPVEQGKMPVEVVTVRFIRKWALLVSGAAGLVLLPLWALLRRRRAAPTP